MFTRLRVYSPGEYATDGNIARFVEENNQRLCNFCLKIIIFNLGHFDKI